MHASGGASDVATDRSGGASVTVERGARRP